MRVTTLISIAITIGLAIPSIARVDADDQAAARVVLTTEPAQVAACSFVTVVSDDEIKDLRKKIARAGGDTALLEFPGGNRITARVYRCPAPQAAPQAAPAPPPLAWNLTGTFSGTLSGNSDAKHWTTEVTFRVVQSGQRLTAQWSTSGGLSGGFSGTLGASGISDLKVQQVNPCPAEFLGVAVVEGIRGRTTTVSRHAGRHVT